MAIGELFPEANVILAAPAGMEGSVLPLHVRRIDGEVISCWRLTPEELEEVNRTGVVWLSIMGQTMPPSLVCGKKADVI